MTEPFLAEIRIFAGKFAPTGWALCNGQLMAISNNTALFSLLGTTYGGDGRVTFGLPDLTAAAPLQPGQGSGLSPRFLGETGGSPSVTLTQAEMPAHTHTPAAVPANGDSASPKEAVWAEAGISKSHLDLYSTQPGNLSMSPAAIAPTGGGAPHNNMPPYLALNFIIALEGNFPQRP